MKSFTRLAFEHALRLTTDQCITDRHGHYINPMTQKLWAAFKAGTNYTPSRGTFVIAEIHNGNPCFPPEVGTFAFKDEARAAQRDQALKTGAICAVYQQVSSFNPSREASK